MCEKEGFIPRYYISEPKDKVDEVLRDMQEYTYRLVTDEMNLGNLIENAVREMTIEENKPEDDDVDDDDLAALDEEVYIEDNDYEEYNDFLDKESALDKNVGKENEGVA